MNDPVFRNARIVAPDFVHHGSLVVSGSLIRSIDGDSQVPAAIDCEGDYLVPGLVELHTDTLEHHMMPRPGVNWPPAAALVAHDAQLAALGITTVLDALSLGVDGGEAEVRRSEFLARMIEQVSHGPNGHLRAEHFLHLRLELTGDNTVALLDQHISNPRLRLASLMDHTPGQRQWHDLARYAQFHSRRSNWSAEQIAERVRRGREAQTRNIERNRTEVLQRLNGREIALASHDDTTAEHAEDAHSAGATISEFPTTMNAAQRACELGLAVMGGAPNLVRGDSHSGNIAVRELAEARRLHLLSSDYAPVSLLHAAFLLHQRHGFGLPDAIATVTATPARLAGFEDRGQLLPGQRADLVRVRMVDEVPVPVGVWREGQRVA